MSAEKVDLRLELSPVPEAAAAARDAMGHFAEDVGEETLENLRLLVSELVTNAFRHAGLHPSQQIELRARLQGGVVRVEVRDDGGGFVPPDEPIPREAAGWGLYLVDHIADRWGVERGEATCVWLELEA